MVAEAGPQIAIERGFVRGPVLLRRFFHGRLPRFVKKVKAIARDCAPARQLIHTFSPQRATIRAMVMGCGGTSEMTDVIDVPAKVVNCREEAKECLQLAQATPEGALRTILMGMALGWLKLANRGKHFQAHEIEHADS
jgi:hypothetical protein